MIEWIASAAGLPAEWEELASRGPVYLSRGWWLADSPLPHEFATLHDLEGRLVAGTACCLTGAETAPTAWRRIDRLLVERAERLSLFGYPRLPAAVAGSLLPAFQCGNWYPSATTVAGSATEPLIEAIEQGAHTRGLASVSFLFVRADDPLRVHLRRLGYLELPSDGTCVLDVRWPDVPGYVEHLPSRRAGQVRRERRILERAGISFRAERLDAELVTRLAPLALQTYERYGGGLTLEELASRLGRAAAHLDTTVVLAESGGTPLGFTALHAWGDTLYAANLFGFDYDRQGSLPLYFGVFFYATIDFAIDRGFARIDYGPTALTAKLRRGCRLVPQLTYVKALDRVKHSALVAAHAHIAGARRVRTLSEHAI
jgi:predicted N-acyltransferase